MMHPRQTCLRFLWIAAVVGFLHCPHALAQVSVLKEIRIHEADKESLIIEFLIDGLYSGYRPFRMEDPPRLILDVEGIGKVTARSSIKLKHPLVSRIRSGEHPGKARIVVDFQGGVFPHTIDLQKAPYGLKLFLSSKVPVPSEGAQPKENPIAKRVESRESPKVEREAQEAPAVSKAEEPPPKTRVEVPPEKKPVPSEAPVKEAPSVPPPERKAPATEKPLKEELTGEEIARRVYNREDGKDCTAEVEMVLIGKGGTRSRELVMYEKDFGTLTHTVIRFTKPSDIKGTAFLTIEKEKEDDEQFLYLPALRRVRRVVSSQKDQRFVSTDFTYEDLERRKVEKDTHRLLKTEVLDGKNCWVVESIPKESARSQYGKIVSWIVQDIYVPIKADYYDKQGKLVKQLKVIRLEKVQGIWTEMETEMHDLKEDHRTLMKIGKIKYNTGLPDSLFTERALMKD